MTDVSASGEALYPTGFHLTLHMALQMGVHENPHRMPGTHSLEALGDCEALHVITELGQPFSMAWFEDEAWAHALTYRLRQLGVNAALAFDADFGGWEMSSPIANMAFVVAVEGNIRDHFKAAGEAALDPVELHMTLRDAVGLAQVHHSGIGPDGRFLEDWDAPSSVHSVDSRLHASILSNVLMWAGYTVSVETYETEIAEGFVYVESSLNTDCPLNVAMGRS